jgi:hypothetical protein
MKPPRERDAGRQAVAWLATAFVILIGAGATAFMVLSMTEQAGWRDWLVWAGCFGGLVWFLWSVVRPQSETAGRGWLRLWLKSTDRSDPLRDYKFRRRRRAPESIPLGGQAPPTVDSVREAAETTIKWVPRDNPPPRDRRKA